MSKALKLIFLDIDGVVNSSRSVFTKLGQVPGDAHPVLGALPYEAISAIHTVDPVCVELINRLIETDQSVGVVLSSTHRKHFHNGDFGSEEHLNRLRVYLSLMGFRLPWFFDVTPVLHRPRGEEVKKYLDELHEKYSVVDFVILDDSADFQNWQPLVRVDATIGMDFANYVDACKFLCVTEPSVVLV